MKKNRFATNLQVLKRSTQKPVAGDVFVLAPRDRGFYFGRVINADVEVLPEIQLPNRKPNPDWTGALVYVYNAHAPEKLPVPELRRDRLLLPPLVLDWVCWTKGYVQTVAHMPLKEQDVLARHCFDDLDGGFIDEFRQKVRRTEPCGVYGLTPFRGFDDEISRAIGMSLAPE